MLTVKMILIALSLSSGSGIAQHMVQSLNTTVQAPNGDWIVTYRNPGTVRANARNAADFTADGALTAPMVQAKHL